MVVGTLERIQNTQCSRKLDSNVITNTASAADSGAERKRKGLGLHTAIGRGSLRRPMERRARAVQESREACSTPPMSATLPHDRLHEG